MSLVSLYSLGNNFSNILDAARDDPPLITLKKLPKKRYAAIYIKVCFLMDRSITIEMAPMYWPMFPGETGKG